MSAALTCQEPALRFWLHYAEREGALVEGYGDRALVVLPSALEAESGLPDELLVTDQPDVAREDGAALMIAGHPAIERASEAVLAEGDTGTGFLAWPTARAPSRSDLQERARESIGIEHGRIDGVGDPVSAYLPLLRVGAMVTYTASLTMRFQEQEEVWLDARTGLGLPDPVLAAVRGRTWLDRPDGPGRHLDGDLDGTVDTAHREIERCALVRRKSLVAHAARNRSGELARADAYYAGALDSIARRRSTAPPDRIRVLDAQAEATRGEHARRRREIEETYEARHEIRPFRLHLLYVPAWLLRVEIRRGERRYPFELCWVPGAATFAAGRCPACGSPEPLVAGRERLGCVGCLAPPAAPAAPATQRSAPPEASAPSAPKAAAPGPGPGPAPARQVAKTAGGRAVRPATTVPPQAQARARGQVADITKVGNRLGLSFWQCVSEGERWPRQKTARNSPLSALTRVYGAGGPLRAIGIPVGVIPHSVDAGTGPRRSPLPPMTSGFVVAGNTRYAYTLLWALQAGKPIIADVMPGDDPFDLPRCEPPYVGLFSRLHGDAPLPGIPLGPVADLLWRVERPERGLPLTVRCLATWWSLRTGLLDGVPPAVGAAAIAYAEGRAAGSRISGRAIARDYGVDPAAFAEVQRRVGALLRPDPRRGW